MNFRQEMQRIVEQTPGAQACTLMGFDGIPIDTFTVADFPVDVVSLVTEVVLACEPLRSKANGSAHSLPGTFESLVVRTSEQIYAMHMVNSAYFLAVLLVPSGVTGKASYMMRLLAPKLQEALA